MDDMTRNSKVEEESDLRRGPWTLEEDTILIHYITCHGEGRWNMLARLSGLKRTGKSCRLRWLNYLKPDVKRGNLTPEEQLLILELHSKWGNRWSRIAQYLPGRTDNEIKNYWRTQVQRQAKQLQCDANSQKFRETVRCHWMPRLRQQQQMATNPSINNAYNIVGSSNQANEYSGKNPPSMSSLSIEENNKAHTTSMRESYEGTLNPENFGTKFPLPPVPEMQTGPDLPESCYFVGGLDSLSIMPAGSSSNHLFSDSSLAEDQWMMDNEVLDTLWNMDEFRFLTEHPE